MTESKLSRGVCREQGLKNAETAVHESRPVAGESQGHCEDGVRRGVAHPIGDHPEVTQAPPGSKKPMMIALIIVLVIAILGVGGFYAYTLMSAPKDTKTADETKAPDTSKADVEALNSEVVGIDVPDPDAALTEIDTEITALDATPAASVKPSPSAKASPSPKISPSPKASASPTIDR